MLLLLKAVTDSSILQSMSLIKKGDKIDVDLVGGGGGGCFIAGGTTGPPFLQCLANCLNAQVKGGKRKVYIGNYPNTTCVESNVWSTVKNFLKKPCEASPTLNPTQPHQ